MNLNSNVRLLITTSPDADRRPQLRLKQSICLLKIQDNETNNEGWWPHLHRRLWHRIWRLHLAVLAIPYFFQTVCFCSSIPLIVFTAATDFKHTQFHGRCSELNCTSGSFLETTWRSLSPASLHPQTKPSPFIDRAASALVSSSSVNNTSTTDKDVESMRFYRSYS